MTKDPEIRLARGWQIYREQQKIYEGNFTQVPNFLLNDDLDLSPHSLKLFLYMLRLCLLTDRGVCNMSSRNLAVNSHMSVGQISLSKKELQEKGLIEIEKVDSGRGQPKDVITITNIWETNYKIWQDKKIGRSESNRSQDDLYRSHDDLIGSPDDMINIDINNKELNNISPMAVSSIPELNPIPTEPHIPENLITQESPPPIIQTKSPAPEIPAFLNVPEIPVLSGLSPEERDMIKNPGAFIALQKNEQRVASGEVDLSWLTESLWPLARAFILASEVHPTRGTRSLWISSLQDLYSDGYNQEDIRQGVIRARKDGLSIKSPKSIIYALIDPVKPAEGGDKIKQAGYISAGQMQDERRALFGRK